MAKVSLNKLNLKKNEEIEVLKWNEQSIEIKQYLPIQDKLNLVATIINNSADDDNFYNPAKIYTYLILNMILFYTNINLTEKQREDITKTYDLIVGSGLSAAIFEKINPYEYQQIKGWVYETIESIYSYRNSVLGILETISENYSEEEMRAEDIQKKLAESADELQLVKDIVDKLG